MGISGIPDDLGGRSLSAAGMADSQMAAPVRPYRSPVAFARLARIFGITAAVASAISAAYLRSATGVIRQLRVDPLSVFQADLLRLSNNIERISYFIVGTVFVTTILLVLWLRRMYRNLASLGKLGTRFRRGWAVWGWFVPVLNLFRPKQMINEVWYAGDLELPARYRYIAPRERVPGVLNVWWGFWIGAGLLGFIQRVQFRDLTLGRFEGLLNVEFAAAVVVAVQMVLLDRVLVRITERQQARALHLGLVTEPVPWTRSPRVDGRIAPAKLALIAAPALLAVAGTGWACGGSGSTPTEARGCHRMAASR